MANPNLVTVAMMKVALQKALADLEQFDDAKPINLAFYDEDVGDQQQHGFLTSFSIEAAASLDDEQADVNLDINYKEA